MKIAVWYHCLINGPGISEDHAICLLGEQMQAIYMSFLEEALDEIHIGINGTDSEALTVSAFVSSQSKLHLFPGGQSELSTLTALQKWLKPGWAVLYHHIKGVQYPGNETRNRWRRCMENVCVWNWKKCVEALGRGFDTVGPHWLTNLKYPMVGVGQRYWGGNFWWAKSDYLMTLPPLPPDTRDNRYEAEVWIGKSPGNVRYHDFAPHWPMSCPA